ncbi:BTB/POZ domain-containing protein 3-like [Paramacrobiotus metropolitanus]|uniref:BTB/POZ domain-containing protein 3-like n=1 Tax=Paramacrobiotus metropolitanus TaxID=2943436 RepID=UPI002445D485|nr:BTB/POZ domain-containing protein 3-like [Paramacrobiotus metropolitanus]
MSQNSTSPAYLQRRGAIDGVIGRMKRALSLAELSDVQFAVGRDHGQEKIFHAHKMFLSLSSDVFHAMFYGNLADGNLDVIQIPEIPSAAFANMLSYMYIRKCRGRSELAERISHLVLRRQV